MAAGGGAGARAQLSRSLERLLDEAALSGELRLSGRKLRELPAAPARHLQDTVLADLSKNRFGEVPDEVTNFYFLERLLLYHNAIRSIPDNFGSLQSLSYLDLSRNQLSEVPRELCLLPLQILLLSNNRLTALPKEIGKMSSLTELDASGNQITQVPMTIGDLDKLKSLNLRSNQLGLLPLQITRLKLEKLDISCNCISSLPIELREMTTLVTLNLEHNPLVFPPATVCIRGRIHIFKYLDNQANKDNIQKRTDDTRRSAKHPHHHVPFINHNNQHPCILISDGLRHKNRYNVDSGYSTSDGGEKRWSSDGIVGEDANGLMITGPGSGRSTPSTPSTISPGPAHLSRAQSLSTDTPPTTPNLINASPDLTPNAEDKLKLTGPQQTYKQYKEALRQQRQQDVYRPRGEQISPPSITPTSTNQSYSTPHSPVANGYNHKNIVASNPSLSTLSTQNSPTNTLSSAHSTPKKYSPIYQTNGSNGTNGSHGINEALNPVLNNTYKIDDVIGNRRPVQKVVPSRSANKNYSPTNIPVSNNSINLSPLTNGNSDYNTYRTRASPENNKQGAISPQDSFYTKPVSPIKGASSFMSHNSVPKSNSLGRNYKTSPTENNGADHMNNGSPKLLTTTVGFVSNTGPAPLNTATKMNWNKDMMPDKFSFTMKREFDRAKEECELILQLKNIIENRLKMTLPGDLAPVLSDGVVLCHLANHIRPRAVASVHVPSAVQPKLTMARCRRNVDNFLEACRKIGVEEEAVCRPQDILPQETDVAETSYERMAAIFKTVVALLALRTTSAHATENREHVTVPDDSTLPEEHDSTEEIKDDNENCFRPAVRSYNEQSRFVSRNRYDEDRCISNFNSFAVDDVDVIRKNFDNSDEMNKINIQNNNENALMDNNKSHEMDNIVNTNIYNRFNKSSYGDNDKILFVSPIITSNRCNGNNSNKLLGSSISERINYFNGNRTNMNLDIKNNLNTIQNDSLIHILDNERNDRLISYFCISVFISTIVLLFLFPLPN